MKIDFPITFDIESHRVVFNHILKYKKISAANLSRITGLQKSSLLYIIRALEARSLIRVHTKEFKTKERGRPSTLYEINGDLYSILGVEILPEGFKIVLTDLLGNILKNWVEEREDLEELLEVLKRIIADENLHNLLGIGVSVPGVIDHLTGEIIYSKPLGIKNYQLQEILSQDLGVTVRVNNDAKSGAIATYLLSEELDPLWDNILYFSVNIKFNGIGVGMIINGQLYNGTTGYSGEIYKKLPTISEISLKNEFSERDKVDELHSAANLIGELIVNTVQLLNPSYFEIGGDITSYKTFITDYLNPEILRLQSRQYFKGQKTPLYKFAYTGEFSNAHGGASLLLKEIVS